MHCKSDLSEKIMLNLFLLVLVWIAQVMLSANVAYANKVQFTDKQARALQSLSTDSQSKTTKSLRLKIAELHDNQGQKYLGALVSRAELLPYLTKMQQLLGDDFNHYRALQAARDKQLFHLTVLSPHEYQLADKGIISELLATDGSHSLLNKINVTLFGLGKVAKKNKTTFFVVVQSADAQLIRQRFILSAKDFHITLGFNPSDIYGIEKGLSTLVD